MNYLDKTYRIAMTSPKFLRDRYSTLKKLKEEHDFEVDPIQEEIYKTQIECDKKVELLRKTTERYYQKFQLEVIKLLKEWNNEVEEYDNL